MRRKTASFPKAYFFDRFEENYVFFHDYEKFHIISIQKSLEEILTTRASYFFCGTGGTPSMFGIPDLFPLDPSQSRQWPVLEDILRKIVLFYEPRLKEPKVSILFFQSGKETLEVCLKGFIFIGEKRFPFQYQGAFQC